MYMFNQTEINPLLINLIGPQKDRNMLNRVGLLVIRREEERKSKRKSGSRQGGQPFDCPEAPTSSDPAAIAQ